MSQPVSVDRPSGRPSPDDTEVLMDLTVYGVERAIDDFMRQARQYPEEAQCHRERMREYADLLQQEADRL